MTNFELFSLRSDEELSNFELFRCCLSVKIYSILNDVMSQY